jgi:hypothetical protein
VKHEHWDACLWTMASHLGDWKEKLSIQMLGMALRIRMYLEQYSLSFSGSRILYLGIYNYATHCKC